MKQLLAFALLLLFTSTSCKKIAGPGGTSAIRGKVMGTTNEQADPGEHEVIDILVKAGSAIEHGDYWLLNGADGNLYYIWYNNPTWISNGDPLLQGRTAIQVNFNYSDDNVTVANNTVAAITAVISNQFQVSQNQDIITLTSTSFVDLSDADNGNSNFNVDVANQGKIPGTSSGEITIGRADERVYLVYGDGEVFNESMKTGGGGEFVFDGLNVGTYTLYALSKDPITGEKVPVFKTVEITEKKTMTDAGTISVLF
jgi:hypothetical protein